MNTIIYAYLDLVINLRRVIKLTLLRQVMLVETARWNLTIVIVIKFFYDYFNYRSVVQ